MKIKKYIIVILVLLAAAFVAIWAVESDDLSRAVDDSTKQVQIVETPASLTYWLMRDDYLPIVSVRMSFQRSGSAYDPADKKGLASMVASLLSEGAGERDASAFHVALENIATSLYFWADKDNFYVSFKTLARHVPKALDLTADALLQPRFDKDAIERVRQQKLVSIQKSQQRPNYLAQQKMNQIFFRDHPYARMTIGDTDSLKRITQEDLRQFVATKLDASKLHISVVGDIGKEALSEVLDQSLSALKRDDEPEEPVSLVHPPLPFAGQEAHIELDVPQTVIQFMSAAPQRRDENFYAMYLLNYILGGGGFESRLMQHIREEQGLVYSVNSYFSYYEQFGFLAGSAATENAKAHKTVDAIKAEYRRLQEGGVTQQELDDAKSYMTLSFPLKMVRNDYLSSFMDAMQRYELGTEFLNQRNQMVEAVTLDDVNAMAREWLDSEKLFVVTVGKELDTP